MNTWRRTPNLFPGAILVASTFALLWSRVLPLTQSLWTDEFHSILFYVDPGPTGIFGHYIPNDHVLFELLAWAWTGLIGDHSEAAYRFWGVAPALAGGLLMTWWLWRRIDPWVAAIFTVLAVASPLYYQLSIEARGYGLAFLGATLMLIGADGFHRNTRTRDLGLIMAGALIGIWTLPVFVLPYLALTGLLLAHLRAQRRRLLVTTGLVGALSALFYAPVLGDVISASKQTFGPTLPWYAFATGPFRDLLAPEVVAVTRGLSPSTFGFLGPGVNDVVPGTSGWPVLLAAAVVLAGVGVAVARREQFLALALLVPAVFTYTVLDIGRLHTVDRFASFLLLPLLVACALALVAFGRWFAEAPGGRVGAGVLAAGFALLLFARTDSQLKLTLAEPYENDRAVAELTAGVRLRSVLSNQEGGDATFYLGPNAISSPSYAQLEALFCSHAGPFVYLQELIAPQGPSTRCLRARGAIAVATPQRHTAGVSAASAPFISWLVAGGATTAAGPTPRSSGGRSISCRVRTRPVAYTSSQPPTTGQPVPVRLPPPQGRGRVVVTVLRTRIVGSIDGGGRANGEAFVASGGFLAIEYELVNQGSAVVIPDRALAPAGVTGDYTGAVQPVGSLDPECQQAESSFAAGHALTDPGAPVAPGAVVKTVAVYPLPPLTPVTRYLLGWYSFLPAIHIALPPPSQ